MKWYRLSKRRPRPGFFIYCEGNYFNVGKWVEIGAYLGNSNYLYLFQEIIDKKLIKYWCRVNILPCMRMIQRDVFVEGEPHQPETAAIQSELTDLEKFELENGVLWKYRAYNSPHLKSRWQKKDEHHDEK